MPSIISLGLLSLATLAAAAPSPAKRWTKPDCSQPAPVGRGARWYARHCGTANAGSAALMVSSGSTQINEAPVDATDDLDVTITSTAVVTVSASPVSATPVSVAPVSVAPSVAAVVPEAAPTTTLVTVAQNYRKTTDTPVVVAAAAATSAAASPVAAAASPVAAAVSSAASVAPASVAASGGKRGVAYNDAKFVAPFSANKKVSWAYNWASAGSGLPSGFEFVPMLWGNGAGPTKNWVSDATKAIASGSTAILGFNEPDHAEQANLPYNVAAASYKQLITNQFAGKARLGSVAVTNGGGSMGLNYLQSFMNACADCQIDFVVVHWYDSATNIQYFKDHVTQAHTMTGKPVWITEFGTTGGSTDQINTFVQTVLPWLDSQSFVERYSYFMASDGILNSGSGLSTYGQTYASI